MKACLICPSHRQGVRLLAESTPLTTLPLLGQSLVEYWMSHLACTGFTEVMLVVEHPAENVRRIVGNGERWGLKATLFDEPCEPRQEQVRSKYVNLLQPAPEAVPIYVLEHFPGFPERQLFSSYAELFAALLDWLPRAKAPDRVGLREIRPGVWVSVPSHISSRAQLHAPCWIGKHVYVGAGAVIGPGTILEDGTFIERKAEVLGSWVGPDTLVGRGTCLSDSLAIGNHLINHKSANVAVVPDPFVLGSLRPAPATKLATAEAMADSEPSGEPEDHWFLKTLLVRKEQ